MPAFLASFYRDEQVQFPHVLESSYKLCVSLDSVILPISKFLLGIEIPLLLSVYFGDASIMQ